MRRITGPRAWKAALRKQQASSQTEVEKTSVGWRAATAAGSHRSHEGRGARSAARSGLSIRREALGQAEVMRAAALRSMAMV